MMPAAPNNLAVGDQRLKALEVDLDQKRSILQHLRQLKQRPDAVIVAAERIVAELEIALQRHREKLQR